MDSTYLATLAHGLSGYLHDNKVIVARNKPLTIYPSEY